MKVALAQISPLKGDIQANIIAHKRFIHHAAKQQAEAIFFPELSLTGYEPTLAKFLALDPEDTTLADFQNLSNKHHLTIGVGLPKKSEKGIYISLLIFQPNQARQNYAKQQLHEDEMPFFVAGDEQLILNIEKETIVPAICYESLQDNHAANASQHKADVYLAS
ncbi:MAG: carbon-nitrogen hydrolase family protein, partial [Bacteroidota bacterium]